MKVHFSAKVLEFKQLKLNLQQEFSCLSSLLGFSFNSMTFEFEIELFISEFPLQQGSVRTLTSLIFLVDSDEQKLSFLLECSLQSEPIN